MKPWSLWNTPFPCLTHQRRAIYCLRWLHVLTCSTNSVNKVMARLPTRILEKCSDNDRAACHKVGNNDDGSKSLMSQAGRDTRSQTNQKVIMRQLG